MKRMKKKVMAKANWFKDQKNEEQPEDAGANRFKTGSKCKETTKETKETIKEISMESRKMCTSSVMFVQSTKAGILVNNLKKGELVMSEMTGFKVNYSEAGGTPLGNMFNVDLGKGLHCGREYCPPCDTSEEGKRPPCKSRSILYKTECSLCNPTSHPEDHQEEDVQPTGSRSRSGVYIGETSRSLNERSIEHLADARSFHPGSHIVKHWMEMHQELNKIPPFKFKVKKTFKDCLSRQISEAVAIMMTGDSILNGKCEYLRNCIARVKVEEDDIERKKREMFEESEEKERLEAIEKFRKEKEPGLL